MGKLGHQEQPEQFDIIQFDVLFRRIDQIEKEKKELFSELDKRFGEIFNSRIPLVKWFSTKTMAEDLGDVECPEPRQEIDWFTAEGFVNDNFSFEILDFLCKTDFVMRVFNSFLKENPDFRLNSTEPSLLKGFFFNNVMKILLALPPEEINSLVNKSLNDSEEELKCHLETIIRDLGSWRLKKKLPPPYGESISASH